MHGPAPDSTPLTPTAPPYRPKVPEDHLFRRTFLARLFRPDDVSAFEAVGVVLAELANEAGAWGPDDDEPLTVMELRSAGEDVALLAEFVRAVAESRFEAVLAPDEARLAERAERWAAQLEALAIEMGAREARGVSH